MKKVWKLLVVYALCLALAGCGSGEAQEGGAQQTAEAAEEAGSEQPAIKDEAGEPEVLEEDAEPEGRSGAGKEKRTFDDDIVEEKEDVIYVDVPAYAGDAYIAVNGNEPYFSEEELSSVSYEEYSELDGLGRCGVCVASVGQDIMPAKERESIGDVKPTGWHTVKYEGVVDGNYLYNRCHLLGFQLTGENANVRNLITGTRYMNVEGMLPFENMVADYVKETGNHVMYRVTPLFDGDNLVADGVLMEAKSVEDDGEGVLFNVFCYNVQPGIVIDYTTGESSVDETAAAETGGKNTADTGGKKERSSAKAAVTDGEGGADTAASEGKNSEASDSAAQEQQRQAGQDQSQPEQVQQPVAPAAGGAYAVNGRNGKIHIVGECPATGTSGNAMAEPVYFGTYEEAVAYSLSIAPGLDKRQCGNCW